MSKKEAVGLKRLTEAVILQALDDLWSKANRRQSIEFFTGEGFSWCVKAAEMRPRDRAQLLRMVGNVLRNSGHDSIRTA